jgi:putative FmdB family regulatory protein
MPLHEYECKQCGRRTEKIQKFSDAPLAECPHCGGPLEQLLHAPAVSFKGGGWYADLYSSSKRSGSGEGKAAADTKSDTPAAKSDNASGTAAAPASTTAPSAAPAAPASSSGSDKK